MNVENKVAIVTGGTGGIGFATVQALLKNRAKHVAMFDIEAAKSRAVLQLQKLVADYGNDRASFVACDVTNRKQFEDCYDDLVKSQKKVDVLINNAGIASDIQIDLTIDLNLKAVVNCTVVAIERMGEHKNGTGGTIVNVSSVAGLEVHPSQPIYHATKFAVYGFTKCLKELYPYIGVRVVAVCPGVTQTDILQKIWRDNTLTFIPDKFLEELSIDLGKSQPPKNVAETIVKMIEKAEAGAIWVSEDNQPPFAVADPPNYRDRKIPLE